MTGVAHLLAPLRRQRPGRAVAVRRDHVGTAVEKMHGLVRDLLAHRREHGGVLGDGDLDRVLRQCTVFARAGVGVERFEAVDRAGVRERATERGSMRRVDRSDLGHRVGDVQQAGAGRPLMEVRGGAALARPRREVGSAVRSASRPRDRTAFARARPSPPTGCPRRTGSRDLRGCRCASRAAGRSARARRAGCSRRPSGRTAPERRVPRRGAPTRVAPAPPESRPHRRARSAGPAR